MALLLSIDTATEYAGVCISNGAQVLAFEESMDQKNHGAFVQPAIQKLMHQLHMPMSAVDAVVLSAGPGSYTGLRVGLSSAKGLCYALQKPLIMINTLELMAYGSILATNNMAGSNADFLFCPMIDARRMEVFAALYDARLKCLSMPSALILTGLPADYFPLEKKIVFSGSGSFKFKNINAGKTAIFLENEHTVKHLAQLGLNAFEKKQFADLAYSEPLYVKEFFTPATGRKN